MPNIKETGRFLGKFIFHPRQTLRELDSQFDKMMLHIWSGGSACEPGMKLPMVEITYQKKEKVEKGGD